jgi:hypothetical protein
MFNAKIVENLISKEDCEYLVNAAIASDLWENGGDTFWNNRVINYSRMVDFDHKASEIMIRSNIECGKKIKELYNLDEDVYSDTLQVIRWFPGMEQSPHADDMSNTDIVGFSHRDFGSILYLNDRYSGGQTYYPNFNINITPQTGSLAIHPGDPEHLHGVTKVEGSNRYTIASFWTKDKEKSGGWSLS